MTSTTKEIFDQFEIRKTRKQKEQFRSWLIPVLERAGYSAAVEKGSMGARNVVIGDIKTADVVFTAHYDTCAVLPFPNFITPKTPALYWLYQFVVMIPIFAVILTVAWVFSLLGDGMFVVGYWIGFLGFMGIMTLGPSNRHTANDNTSGTTAVIDLALAMPVDQRMKAAYVLFDLEESGLIGSSSFAKAHKKAMKDKLLVNLDCVSDGENMLFVLKKGARPHLDALKAAFPSDDRVSTEFMTKGYIYPSDQASFKCGVGVCALLRNKWGLLYMDKIHTPKDRVYREENIAYLVDGCIRLTERMGNKNGTV